ncbi:branched-chain amino acid ABC transporter permease [soil metagenome]
MLLFADALDWPNLTQIAIDGLRNGLLFALIALGYTMVYGIVELINFAHGDLFMLGCCLTLTVVSIFADPKVVEALGITPVWLQIAVCLMVVPVFCACLNFGVDRVIYKPLRNAPKLAPLVSAIGVSFIFMMFGLFWEGPQDVNFPNLLPTDNVFAKQSFLGAGPAEKVILTWKTIVVVGVTLPLMIALTYFVKFTSLGKAMRATAQNPTAARLMGINTDRVIGVTFIIGGTLAGFGSVIYGLTINTVSYQMGFQNGLYAFTAAVLGGIGNIPGAVLGGLLIGMVRAIGSSFIGETWTPALVFAVLIVVLVFRPAGLLGARVREKV